MLQARSHIGHLGIPSLQHVNGSIDLFERQVSSLARVGAIFQNVNLKNSLDYDCLGFRAWSSDLNSAGYTSLSLVMKNMEYSNVVSWLLKWMLTYLEGIYATK